MLSLALEVESLDAHIVFFQCDFHLYISVSIKSDTRGFWNFEFKDISSLLTDEKADFLVWNELWDLLFDHYFKFI